MNQSQADLCRLVKQITQKLRENAKIGYAPGLDAVDKFVTKLQNTPAEQITDELLEDIARSMY